MSINNKSNTILVKMKDGKVFIFKKVLDSYSEGTNLKIVTEGRNVTLNNSEILEIVHTENINETN